MTDVLERCSDYLKNGGLFNPELMDHNKVRDLVTDCRDEIETLRLRVAALEATVHQTLNERRENNLRENSTLRDQFAMAALTGVLAYGQRFDVSAAADAYSFADEMLKERGKDRKNESR